MNFLDYSQNYKKNILVLIQVKCSQAKSSEIVTVILNALNGEIAVMTTRFLKINIKKQ